MEAKPHFTRKVVGIVLASVFAGLAAAVTIALQFDEVSTLATRVLGGNEDTVPEEVKAATDAEALALADQIVGEGAVLLENDGLLPFDRGVTQVNVFGWASVDWRGGGSGSGGIDSTDVGLIDALNAYGIRTNTRLTEMYRSFKAPGQRRRTLSSTPEASSTLYEPSIGDETYYPAGLLQDARDFSDTAIVVLGRYGGESNDFTLEQYKVTTADGETQTDATRTSLDLSTEEEELLAYVCRSYPNVVVVINAANTLNLGYLDELRNVDAVLLAGYTGQYSARVLPKILWGEVNPSGRTVDTWTNDLTSAPSYASSSENVGVYAGAEGLYPAQSWIYNGNLGLDGDDALYQQVSYLDYSEGVYVGYKWYETADAEGFWDGRSGAHGEGYDAVVRYPFGYGLSYTSFAWEVVGGSQDGGFLGEETSVTVRVTNTGEVAGKDVVELYWSAPYLAGQIEKPALELGAFAKTRLLGPGESQELTLAVQTYDMASYDFSDANGNGFRGYELDAGTYEFSLRHDAHTPDDAPGATFSQLLATGRRYERDPVTGAEVKNRFTGSYAADGVGIDGSDTGQDVRYLSRADFSGTYPETASTRVMPESVAAYNLFTDEDAAEAWAASAEMPGTNFGRGLLVEEDGVITDLGRALGADFDDPRWENVLDELSPAQMRRLVTYGYSGTGRLDAVGKDYEAKEADGPAQIGGFIPLNPGLGFPCTVVLAQTWNAELANLEGRVMGEQATQRGSSGWYAPACNLHRSPFGGRNYEYWSEDGVLSGVMCGNVVSGAADAGVYCYVKHLVCNDGEAYIYRDGVYTWMTEQTLRETYLEPFRIVVESYDATAVMSAYGRIGAVWTGGSHTLVSDVLRGEWGFDGCVITDFTDHYEYMNGDQMLLAGGDLWMNLYGKLRGSTNQAALVQELRRASKDVLYTYLHARVRNEAYVAATGDEGALRPTTVTTSPLDWAVPLVDVAAAGLLVLAVWRLRVGRRERG